MTEKWIRYHEEKAKGGWGLIIPEDYSVHPNGKGYDRIPGFYSDDYIAMNKVFTERIHKYGTSPESYQAENYVLRIMHSYNNPG